MKSHHIYLFLITCALLPCPILAGQQKDSSNPAYIGIIYYLDPSAKLLALDRQIPSPKAGFKAFGFGGVRAVVELDAERASLRIPSNQELSFIVELASGVDPREFQLYPLEVRRGKRQLAISSGSIFRGERVQLGIQINISRYGENTYKITPAGKLAVGEYVFIGRGATEMFSFGVDKRD